MAQHADMPAKKNDDHWLRITVKVNPEHLDEFREYLRASSTMKKSFSWVMPSWLWREIRELDIENPAKRVLQVLKAWETNQRKRQAGETGGPRLMIEVPEGFGDRLQKMADATSAGSVSTAACAILERALTAYEQGETDEDR